MLKPSRLLRRRSYLVLILILFALVLPLTVVLAVLAAPGPAPEAATSLPATSQEFQIHMPIILRTEWTELARSTDGAYGLQTLGRWKRVSYDAYNGCPNAAHCPYYPFEPTNPSDPTWGPLANWWTEG